MSFLSAPPRQPGTRLVIAELLDGGPDHYARLEAGKLVFGCFVSAADGGRRDRSTFRPGHGVYRGILVCRNDRHLYGSGTIAQMDIVGAVGTVATLLFGGFSFYQWTDIRAMKKALRAHAQSTSNAWWYVGLRTERLLTLDDVHSMRQQAAEINGISHTVRNQIISLSRDYAGFVPFYEPAWEPRQTEEK